MILKSYTFRLKTAIETFNQQKSISKSDNLLIYFKGEHGLTQTLTIPLNKLNKAIYETTFELLDVGNLSVAHVKLDANNVRWKLESIELENNDEIIFNFPINRWFDSDRNRAVDVLINEGPAQLAPIYTIIVHTSTISSCSDVNIHLALIGDGASTIPINLNSNSSLIQCKTNKNLFQSGSKDMFYISSFESADIGQLFHLQLWCDSRDKLPYYCESIEIINNLKDEKYFFLINHWFGPNLEQDISVPVINQSEEPNVFTISIKTTDISEANSENMIYMQMKFASGKFHEEALSLSETHQIPFQKNNIDFFMITIDDINDTEISNVKICFVNKSPKTKAQIQWNCASIEIRDIFYQRNYRYILPKPLISNFDQEPYNYTTLERINDPPLSNLYL